MKKCKDCLKKLPLTDFYPSYESRVYKGKIIYRPDCKACNKKKSTKWGRKNKHKHYCYDIKYKHKIESSEYEKKVEQQENKCALCLESNDGKKRKLHLDHCHVTGKIRGLLCMRCNMGLGFFKDSVELCKRVLTYLEYYAKTTTDE